VTAPILSYVRRKSEEVMRTYGIYRDRDDIQRWTYGAVEEEGEVAGDTGLPTESTKTCETLVNIPPEVLMILEAFDRLLKLGESSVAAHGQA
jgi:hypothetical protein